MATTTAPEAKGEGFTPAGPATATLSLRRLNVMRIGYLVMGVGLAFLKWPLFFQDGGLGSLPVFEGVVAALLTAMGLLAFLGLRYPIQLLPLLIFESLWKLIWLGSVGVPHLLAGDMDAEMSTVFSSVLVVVVILAVIPWRYVVAQYVTRQGDPWRSHPTQPAYRPPLDKDGQQPWQQPPGLEPHRRNESRPTD